MENGVEQIQSLLSQLYVRRLRSELVLDELIENNYYKPSEVLISPESSSSYHHEQDITSFEEVFDSIKERSWIKVVTPQDGFFDYLPERLFHQPVGRLKNEEDWNEVRNEESKQETQARQFFLPFDHALNLQKVRVSNFETKALEGANKDFLKHFLTLFWPGLSLLTLSEDQQGQLFKLTFVSHSVVGDIPKTQEYFDSILKNPIDIQLVNGDYALTIPTGHTPLGNTTLGVNWIAHTDKYAKPRMMKIRVGPLFYEEMEEYFTGGKKNKLIHFLCELLIPAELDWEIVLIPQTKKAGETTLTPINFMLNQSGKPTLLGYTSVL